MRKKKEADFFYAQTDRPCRASPTHARCDRTHLTEEGGRAGRHGLPGRRHEAGPERGSGGSESHPVCTIRRTNRMRDLTSDGCLLCFPFTCIPCRPPWLSRRNEQSGWSVFFSRSIDSRLEQIKSSSIDSFCFFRSCHVGCQSAGSGQQAAGSGRGGQSDKPDSGQLTGYCSSAGGQIKLGLLRMCKKGYSTVLYAYRTVNRNSIHKKITVRKNNPGYQGKRGYSI